MVAGVPVSSSEVRTALQRGDVVAAARFLGRPYCDRAGRVTSGAGRGRTLGFPTANLAPDGSLLIPRGVYGCLAHVGRRRAPGRRQHRACARRSRRRRWPSRPIFSISLAISTASGCGWTSCSTSGRRCEFPRWRISGPRSPRTSPRRVRGSPVVNFTSGGPRGTLPSYLLTKQSFFGTRPWGCVSGARRLEEASRWRLHSTARRA